MESFLLWLAKLRGIQVEPGETLRLEFAGFPEGGAGLFILLGTGLALLLIAAIYRKDTVGLGLGRRVLLGSLRCLAVLALISLFLEPSLVVVRREVKPGHTILLIDKSRSMAHRDAYRRSEDYRSSWAKLGVTDPESLSRLDLVRRLLGHDDGAVVRKLADKNQLMVYAFDGALHALPVIQDESADGRGAGKAEPGKATRTAGEGARLDLTQLTADGNLTNLRDAVRGALERSLYANIASVVVLSDGRRNAGLRSDEAGRGLRQRKVDKVLVVGIGDPAETQSVEVMTVEAPERAFQKDPFEVRTRIVARGYDAITVRVKLTEVPVAATGAATGGGTPLDTREITIGGSQPEVDVQFPPVVASAAGKFDYRVEVEPPTGEPFDENRHRKQERVEVLSEQIRVLLIAGGASYEYQILRNLLTRDKTIDVSCWLQSADIDFVQEGDTPLKELPVDRKQLDVFDVVILVDPDDARLDRTFCDNIAAQVEQQGTGLWFVAGEKFTFRSFLDGSTLKRVTDLLPIVPDMDKAKNEHELGRFFPTSWPWDLTAAGKNHKLVRLVDASAEANEFLWGKLAGYHWAFRVLKPKPAAEVLIGHADPQRRVAGEPEPLMATQYVGAGRVTWTGTDETYRWRSTAEQEYNRYWVKGIRHLYEGRIAGGSSRLRLSVEEPIYEVGQEVKITARAKDENFQPLTASELAVRGRSDRGDERTLSLKPVAGKPGAFEGTFSPPLGLWEVGAAAADSSGKSAPVSFRMIPPQLEGEGPMDRQELSDLASAGQGVMVMPHELAAALDGVVSRESRQSIRIPHTVWDSWFSLTLFVALLCLEWILRKQMNLL